ncbi:MAG: DUF2975 domain-containing protein [Colwellia polaris]|jgi:hypothetical protein|uniref:DUF2975 domain-containing protein n=1 Tax=Colwellia polaris TaxID=326537 RepID=UPI000A1729EC|nr:DUF2975 domain-containing protein [Colwellia polaris]|tara:strand:- start:16412 stop:17005 length:594 start_codon:yes stop_codon:yes gene_type:complete
MSDKDSKKTQTIHRIIRLSKITKLMILIGGAIHISVFLFFVGLNSDAVQSKQSFGDNNVNLSAISEKWSSYASSLESSGLNSFWILGTVDFIAQLFVLFFLFKLFCLYEKGEIFMAQSCRYLQLIGITLFSYGIVMIFLPSAVSFIINLLFEFPKLEVNYYFGSAELTQLIWGAVILVISSIMKEACTMKDEQGLVI